jgi:hypothetical protein
VAARDLVAGLAGGVVDDELERGELGQAKPDGRDGRARAARGVDGAKLHGRAASSSGGLSVDDGEGGRAKLSVRRREQGGGDLERHGVELPADPAKAPTAIVAAVGDALEVGVAALDGAARRARRADSLEPARGLEASHLHPI